MFNDVSLLSSCIWIVSCISPIYKIKPISVKACTDCTYTARQPQRQPQRLVVEWVSYILEASCTGCFDTLAPPHPQTNSELVSKIFMDRVKLKIVRAMELFFFLIWLKFSVFTSYFTKSTIISRKQSTFFTCFLY